MVCFCGVIYNKENVRFYCLQLEQGLLRKVKLKIKKPSLLFLFLTLISGPSFSSDWITTLSTGTFSDDHSLLVGTVKRGEGALVFSCNSESNVVNGAIAFSFSDKNWLQGESLALVRLRVDDNKPIQGYWFAYGKGPSIVEINADLTPKIINELKSGNEMIFQANAKSGESKTIAFNLSGSSLALNKIESACPSLKALPITSTDLEKYIFYKDKVSVFISSFEEALKTQELQQLKELQKAQQEKVEQFNKAIQNHVNRNWYIPALAPSGARNVVKVYFGRDGHILKVELNYSSGDIAFDNSTLAVMRGLGGLNGLDELSIDVFRSNFSPLLVNFQKP